MRWDLTHFLLRIDAICAQLNPSLAAVATVLSAAVLMIAAVRVIEHARTLDLPLEPVMGLPM